MLLELAIIHNHSQLSQQHFLVSLELQLSIHQMSNRSL